MNCECELCNARRLGMNPLEYSLLSMPEELAIYRENPTLTFPEIDWLKKYREALAEQNKQ